MEKEGKRKSKKSKKLIEESDGEEEEIISIKAKRKDESNKRLLESIGEDENIESVEKKTDKKKSKSTEKKTGYRLYDQLVTMVSETEKIDTSNLLLISKFSKEEEYISILVVSLIQHHYYVKTGKYNPLPYTCRTNLGDRGFRINDTGKLPQDLKNILSCFLSYLL